MNEHLQPFVHCMRYIAVCHTSNSRTNDLTSFHNMVPWHVKEIIELTLHIHFATFAIAEVDASPLESTPGMERASGGSVHCCRGIRQQQSSWVMKDAAKARTRNGGAGELGASQKAEDFPQRHIFCLSIDFCIWLDISNGSNVFALIDIIWIWSKMIWMDVEPIVSPKYIKIVKSKWPSSVKSPTERPPSLEAFAGSPTTISSPVSWSWHSGFCFFTGFRGWCTTFLGLGWKVSETQVEVKTWMNNFWKPNKHKQPVLAPPGRAYATFPCPHGVDSQPLGDMHPGSFEDCLYAWCLRLPWTCRKRWGPVEILKHPLNSPLAISS